MEYNINREIWEGWTVKDYIDELEWQLDMIQNGESWKKPIKTKSELINWCKSNQSYYKESIPELITYFCDRYNLVDDAPIVEEYVQMRIPGV